MTRAHRVGVAILALGLSSATRAAAQACCTATGSEEFGVVSRCSSAVIAAQLAAEHALGSFDAAGRHRSIAASVDDVVLVLGAGVRLWPRALQIHGSVPFRLQRRDFPGLEPKTAAGLGDLALALRWTAISDLLEPLSADPATWLPYLDFHAGSRVPTGRPPEDSEEPSGADVTGDGTWSPFAGVKVSKFFGIHHAAQLQAGYTARLARDVPAGPGGGAASFDAGDVITLRAAWLYLHDLTFSGGPFVQLELTGPAEQDGQRIAGSDARRLRFGAHLSWVLEYPIWEAMLSASTDAFWDGAAKNVPFAGPAVGVSLSRHFP
jgi:hypothetical protein